MRLLSTGLVAVLILLSGSFSQGAPSSPPKVGDTKYYDWNEETSIAVRVLNFENGTVEVEAAHPQQTPMGNRRFSVKPKLLFDTPVYTALSKSEPVLIDIERLTLAELYTEKDPHPHFWGKKIGVFRDGRALVQYRRGGRLYREEATPDSFGHRVPTYFDEKKRTFREGQVVSRSSDHGHEVGIVSEIYDSGSIKADWLKLGEESWVHNPDAVYCFSPSALDILTEVSQYKRFNFLKARYETFHVGSRVSHPRLGRGEVIELYSEGRAWVEYDSEIAGEKPNPFPLVRRLTLVE